jgi:hypothetical protein
MLFSCAVPENNEYGTLVLALPGDASPGRAAVSDTFTATLKYDILCTGPGGETRLTSSGGSISVPLVAGNWTVTVSVLNAAGEPIGSKTVTALVESGRSTRVEAPVRINTGGNDITEFTLITGAEPVAGVIDQEEKVIAVFVPSGTSLTSLGFTLVHTGAAVNPAPGTLLDFTGSQTFTITAENGTAKTYTVTAAETGGTSEDWPDTSVWAAYGLSRLQAPSGAIITSVTDNETKLVVKLLTVDIVSKAYDSLIDDIEAITGVEGSKGGFLGATYTLNYTGHTLTLTDLQLVLTLTVTKN